MRAAIISAALSLVAVTLIFSLGGCDKKVTDQEKSIIASLTLDAQERAAAFDVAKSQIVAATPNDSAIVAHFIANQSDSLHALATGLQSLGGALTNGSNLSQNARDALSQEADTATARAADLRAMAKYLTADPATLTFLAAHQAALDAQATSLQQLKALFVADAAPKLKTSAPPTCAKK